MKKLISEFNISSKVTKGTTNQLIICPNCKHSNVTTNVNKLTYSKIKSIQCERCNYHISIGDIFNFNTGTKLNNRNMHYNQDTLDKHIWNDNYDKI